jgi:RNA polymerase sigma-70 factor (ECF subfamily)
LARLTDTGDGPAWQRFVEAYGELIYRIARRAGLDEAGAREVTQDTCVTVSQAMAQFRYDRSRCAFRSWLYTLTRRRVADYLRRQGRGPLANAAQLDDSVAEMAPEAHTQHVDWDSAWREEVMALAMERTKVQVSPLQFQIFECSAVKGWKPPEVARTLGVGVAQVYLARHRVGRVVQAEVRRLEAAGW